MTHATLFLALLVSLMSAIAYRLRGSALFADLPPDYLFAKLRGDRLFKLALGSFPVALAAWLSGIPLAISVAVWVGVLLADTLPHAELQGASDWRQVLGLCSLGALCAIPPALAFTYVGDVRFAVRVLAFGILVGPAYLVGNRVPLPSFKLGPLAAHACSPEWGELLCGFTRTSFLFLV